MNRVIKIEQQLDIPEARRVIALRNRVIHGYDSVDDVLVWSVVINYLPELKKKIENIIS